MQVRTPNISGNDPRAWADLKRWCGNVAAALRELHSAVHKPTVMFGGNVVVRRWSEGDSTSSWRVQAGAIFISGVEKLPVRYSDDAAYARGDWAEIRDDASDLETDEFTVYLAYSASGDKAYYTTDETDEDIAYPIASWNGSNMTPHVGGDVTHGERGLIPYDSPYPEAPIAGGDNGTSDEYARGDHAHPLEMPDPALPSDGAMLITDGGEWTSLPHPAGPAVLVYDASSGVRWQIIDRAYKGIFRNASDQIDDDYVRAF